MGVPGDVFADSKRTNSRQLGQSLVEIAGVFPPLGVLGFESFQLLEEDGALKLRHAVVPAQPVMLVPGPADFPPAPDVRLAEFSQVSIIGGD